MRQTKRPSVRIRRAMCITAGAAVVAVVLIVAGLRGTRPESMPLPTAGFDLSTSPAALDPPGRVYITMDPQRPGRSASASAPEDAADGYVLDAGGRLSSLAANRVYVPSLGIDAPIIPVQAAGKVLDPPADPRTVGRYAASAPLTGDQGTVLLTSHVNWVGKGLGAFYPLATITPNAAVWTTDEHGRESQWRVVKLSDPLKTAGVDQSIFDAAGPRRLVLVTCGGAVHHGSYDHLVIAYAEPVNG